MINYDLINFDYTNRISIKKKQIRILIHSIEREFLTYLLRFKLFNAITFLIA